MVTEKIWKTRASYSLKWRQYDIIFWLNSKTKLFTKRLTRSFTWTLDLPGRSFLWPSMCMHIKILDTFFLNERTNKLTPCSNLYLYIICFFSKL
jgi:hypothetical protein